MDVLSMLALVLLTLVGYSSGATLVGKGKKVTPDLSDVAAVVLLWAAAVAARPILGKWLSIGVWLGVGLVVGALGVALRQRRYPLDKAAAPPAGRGLERLWQSWKACSLRLGNYQSRVWLALFYFLIVIPFGLGVRLFVDPLRLKARPAESAWTAREKSAADLESARSQF
ncbi:MAG: hypothetical protein JW850_08220 [Thermoflexales bacterium]|nr:hypothetical protein [Thermoflexales bacterium]